MLTTQDFIGIFQLEYNLLKSQTAGLTHADSLLQPQPTGNCMNWILGHMLESQAHLVTELGGQSPVAQSDLAGYASGSPAVTADGPAVWQLERLLAGHESVQNALVARLGEMNAADFAREVQSRWGMVTLGYRLLFFQFHFTYHLGQLEQLRQLAGRSEKVI